jgi:hypothetical protein
MEVDDDVRQLALQGKRVRAIQLLRERTGADFSHANEAVNALLPKAYRGRARGFPLWLIGAILFAVVLTTTIVLVFAVNHLLPSVLRPLAVWLEPVTRPVIPLLRPVIPLLLRPEGPLAVAALIVVVARPLARRYRRPARFRAGIIAIALALATFWPLQYLAANLELGYREYNMFLHGLAFFISICLLTGGIEGIRRASNSPEDDSWEWLD